MGQTIAEAIWEEGLLKGLDKGRSEGSLGTARQMLRHVLAKRFGQVPEAMDLRINNVTDVDRLMAAALEAWEIAAPEDLQL